MTSTLQQEASRKLRFSAQTTMRVAQRLYENGYITYMRTDSTTLSESALTAAREPGDAALRRRVRPDAAAPLRAQGQERAGGARGDPSRRATASARRRRCERELIARRARALRADLEAHGRVADGGRAGPDRLAADRRRRRQRGETVEFGASGTVITFRGFLAAYEEGRDDDARRRTTTRSGASRTSPRATRVELRELEPQGHETNPPARYTEATLVRTLEERGIGRPSTYASILGTILDRGYVFKRGTALVPVVPRVLRRRPARAALRPARRLRLHRARWRTTSTGSPPATRQRGRLARAASTSATDDAEGLHELVTGPRRDRRARGQLDRDRATGIVLRVGRYGPYLERDGQRASVPEDTRPRRADGREGRGAARAAVAATASSASIRRPGARSSRAPAATARTSPRCCPEGSKEKPRTASLFKSMSLETVTLEDALRLLSLPRVRRRRRGRRGDRRAERPLRAVRPEGQGDALARDARSSSSRSRSRRRSRCSRSRSSGAAAARRRRRSQELGADPVERQADRRQGGPLRPVRHRRRDEREPPRATIRRRSRSTAPRAARRAPREGPGEDEARPRRRKRFLRPFSDKLRRPVARP